MKGRAGAKIPLSPKNGEADARADPRNGEVDARSDSSGHGNFMNLFNQVLPKRMTFMPKRRDAEDRERPKDRLFRTKTNSSEFATGRTSPLARLKTASFEENFKILAPDGSKGELQKRVTQRPGFDAGMYNNVQCIIYGVSICVMDPNFSG